MRSYFFTCVSESEFRAHSICLSTLNMPIQNIKCPKNTKNACADIIFSPAIVKLELCRICTSMPNPICVTGNAIHESHCSMRCFVLGYVVKDDSDYRVLLFLLQGMKCASMCFTHHPSFISQLKASDGRYFGVSRALNILNGHV